MAMDSGNAFSSFVDDDEQVLTVGVESAPDDSRGSVSVVVEEGGDETGSSQAARPRSDAASGQRAAGSQARMDDSLEDDAAVGAIGALTDEPDESDETDEERARRERKAALAAELEDLESARMGKPQKVVLACVVVVLVVVAVYLLGYWGVIPAFWE